MREHTMTPSRFLRGLIAALAVQNVTRLSPAGNDRPGFASVHRYLQSAVAHDADVGDEDFTRAELEALVAGLAPGAPLNEALRDQVPALLREDGEDRYQIVLEIAGATTLLTGYDTQEMGFIAVAAHVFLRDSAVPE